MPPTVLPDDIVRVENHEEYVVKVGWANRTYDLPPNKPVFIPAVCAFTWFGDPRSTDTYQSLEQTDGTRAFIADRASEVRRLRIKWGAGIAGDEATFEGIAVPDVHVFTAEGEEITTVIQDPTGETVITSVHSQRDDTNLRELVAAQQRQIEAMKQHLGLEDEDTVAASQDEIPRDDNDLPEPKPAKVTVK